MAYGHGSALTVTAAHTMSPAERIMREQGRRYVEHVRAGFDAAGVVERIRAGLRGAPTSHVRYRAVAELVRAMVDAAEASAPVAGRERLPSGSVATFVASQAVHVGQVARSRRWNEFPDVLRFTLIYVDSVRLDTP